jgi:hypothetical protein
MRSDQFAFWLQGWFELNEEAGQTVFDYDNVYQCLYPCIRSHLKLVFELEPNPSKLCVWLDGYLEAVYNPFDFTSTHLLAIKARLDNEFIHVIDKSYPPEKTAALNAIHTKNPAPHAAAPGLGPFVATTVGAQPVHPAKDGGPVSFQPNMAQMSFYEQMVKTNGGGATLNALIGMLRTEFERDPGPHPHSFQYVKGEKMGYDGVTKDTGHHMSTNNEAYHPGARC